MNISYSIRLGIKTIIMISQIIESFQTLVDAAAATKDKGWQFKIKNYQKAIKLLTTFLETNPTATITTIDQAYELFRDNGWTLKGEPYQDGLGYQDRTPKSAILKKIHELLTHGQIKMVESAKLDPRILAIKDLCRIPGVGPSKANLLYEQGFTSISDIRNNLSSTKPSIDLTHAQTIGLRHLEDLEKRIPRPEVDQWNTLLSNLADSMGVSPDNRCVVGSYRRGKPDSGDVDFYVSVHPKAVHKWMKIMHTLLLSNGILEEDNLISLGKKKMMFIATLPNATQTTYRHIDIFVYPFPQYPFAILHATGSREFNIKLRQHALSRGLSLSEHGLKNTQHDPPTHVDSKTIQDIIDKPNFTTEQDIFLFLDYPYIPPEHR